MKSIRHYDKRQLLFARDGLHVAFFCKGPIKDFIAAAGAVFEAWLQWTPEEAKRWSVLGASSTEEKPCTPQTIGRCRALLDPAKASKRAMTALELLGPQDMNPDWRVLILTDQDAESDGDPETHLLELHVPSTLGEVEHVESLVGFIKQAGAVLPYVSGYASLGLTCGADSQETKFAQVAVPLAKRHPGLDLAINDSTRIFLGYRARGAFWLTLLGPELVTELGGEESLRGKLDPQVSVEPVGRGLMLRAGAVPDPGDVNRAERLPLVRSVAAAIEPVTQFDDADIENVLGDEDTAAEWKRRHLD